MSRDTLRSCFCCIYLRLRPLSIWNGVDIDMRALLDEPERGTSFNSFHQKLEVKELICQERIETGRASLPMRHTNNMWSSSGARGSTYYQRPGYQSAPQSAATPPIINTTASAKRPQQGTQTTQPVNCR